MLEHKTGRKLYIQILNVISCAAVVFLHTNGCFWDFSYERYWLTANVIESVLYFAVPVFFMISGATLLDYTEKYSTKEFFIRRIRKTVLPFFIWSFFGMLYKAVTEHIKPGSIAAVTENILQCRIVGAYWFFPCLFAAYMAIPLFAAIPKERRKNAFSYAIGAAFFFNSLFPFLCTLLKISYNNSLQMPAVMGYTIYLLIGYWIDHYEIPLRGRKIIYAAGAAGLMMHLFGTWYLSYRAGEIVQSFKGYQNVPCMLFSVAVFTFFKYMKNERLLVYLDKVTSPLSSVTFGVYLTHWFVIDCLRRLFDFSIYSIGYRIFGGLFVFLFCAVLVKTAQKIPVIQKILP